MVQPRDSLETYGREMRMSCGPDPPAPPMNHDTGSEGVKGESSLMTLRSVMEKTHAFLRTRTDLSRLG